MNNRKKMSPLVKALTAGAVILALLGSFKVQCPFQNKPYNSNKSNSTHYEVNEPVEPNNHHSAPSMKNYEPNEPNDPTLKYIREEMGKL